MTLLDYIQTAEFLEEGRITIPSTNNLLHHLRRTLHLNSIDYFGDLSGISILHIQPKIKGGEHGIGWTPAGGGREPCGLFSCVFDECPFLL